MPLTGFVGAVAVAVLIIIYPSVFKAAVKDPVIILPPAFNIKAVGCAAGAVQFMV